MPARPTPARSVSRRDRSFRRPPCSAASPALRSRISGQPSRSAVLARVSATIVDDHPSVGAEPPWVRPPPARPPSPPSSPGPPTPPASDARDPRPPALRHQRLLRRGDALAAARERLQGPPQHDQEGRRARPDHRRRRGRGDEGMGHGARGHPLHPLVPADDRPHGREARLVPVAHRRRHRDRRVQRQGAGPGRARRLQLPLRRHPRHLRGPRLHRLGPHQPRLHPREPQRHHPLHPDRLLFLDRRGARQEDPPAPLDGRRLQAGPADPQAVQAPTPRTSTPPAAPSRNTS